MSRRLRERLAIGLALAGAFDAPEREWTDDEVAAWGAKVIEDAAKARALETARVLPAPSTLQ